MKKRTETNQRNLNLEVRKKDLHKYTTNLTKANTQYANELNQYIQGFILPLVSDFTAINTQNEKILTDEFRSWLLAAAEFAYSIWRMQAHFQNVTINGASATGTPGCLTGPQLNALFLMDPKISTLDGIQAEIAHAVAEGISVQFAQWQIRVTVPGLPWYPSFMNWPGPMAAPTPNVPVPLLACASDKLSCLTYSGEMQSAIEKYMTTSHKKLDQYDNFIYGLCFNLCHIFYTKLATTQVSLVMGTGPVPTYVGALSGPYSGPVVSGWILPSGLHLAT